MRVMGVDPGLTRCGLGVVDATAPRRASLVAAGLATSSSDDDVDIRLLAIAEVLDDWMDRWAPDIVAVEQVFAQVNVRTVIGTAQVAGAAMLAAARRGIPVATHTPTEVKAAVTGSGRADKHQVRRMVTQILHLEAELKPADVTDALALAVCHLWRPAGALAGPRRPAAAMTPAQRAWAEAEHAARGSR